MKQKFKVGDSVLISTKSCYFNTQGHHGLGKVINAEAGYERFAYHVKFNDSFGAGYHSNHLIFATKRKIISHKKHFEKIEAEKAKKVKEFLDGCPFKGGDFICHGVGKRSTNTKDDVPYFVGGINTKYKDPYINIYDAFGGPYTLTKKDLKTFKLSKRKSFLPTTEEINMIKKLSIIKEVKKTKEKIIITFNHTYFTAPNRANRHFFIGEQKLTLESKNNPNRLSVFMYYTDPLTPPHGSCFGNTNNLRHDLIRKCKFIHLVKLYWFWLKIYREGDGPRYSYERFSQVYINHGLPIFDEKGKRKILKSSNKTSDYNDNIKKYKWLKTIEDIHKISSSEK